MTQERIDLTQFEGIRKDWLYQEVKDSGNSEYATVNGGEFSDILFFIDRAEISEAELKALTMVPGLIAELKRCYKELDELPTRQELMDIFDYQKWLEYVESCFLADGSFNQDADFVRKCAVNNKYGYRIEVIDGVETVVHESEY